MKRSLLVALVCATPAPLPAQLGELQVGVVSSYGMRDPYRAGAGLVLGVAPGRLLYVGLRWTYYAGATTGADVKNRAQVFATDFDVLIPVRGGRIEMRPGIGLGLVQVVQRDGGVTRAVAKEFCAAPGLALQLSAGRFALVPELQYYFTGRSELTWPVHTNGLVGSVRLVFLSEIRRIRR